LRVGVRWTIFAGLQSGVRANEKERTILAALRCDTRLVANSMQTRGNVT
jgi:hypothetical protein